MSFRDRLLATLRAVRSVLDEPGIMLAGSQVPNLLEPGAGASLVVSQDVDIAVPVEKHDAVTKRLARVNELEPSRDEPSVWVPKREGIIEVNRSLSPEQRYTVRSNLSLLSLLEARSEMPDPVPHRARLAELMRRLEEVEPG